MSIGLPPYFGSRLPLVSNTPWYSFDVRCQAMVAHMNLTANYLSANLRINTGTMRLALYDDNGTDPVNLLAYTDEIVSVHATNFVRYRLKLNTPVEIERGTVYWFGYMTEFPANALNSYGITAIIGYTIRNLKNGYATYPTFPDPYVNDTNGTNQKTQAIAEERPRAGPPLSRNYIEDWV